jgi:hypothetical protein
MPSFSFLAIQALGLFPSVVCFLALQGNSRKRILLVQCGCCVLWGLHYGLLGAYTAVLTNLLGLIRATLCYHNEKPWFKHRFWPVVLIALYFSCAALTWDGPYCLLPCLSMALTTVALWTHNMTLTRLLFVLNSPPLLVYNLITGSYACFAVECCAFLSFLIAVYRFDIRKQPEDMSQEV